MPAKSTLTPDILIRAYAGGIFPMADSADSPEIFWVDPEKRGIFPLDAFHVPQRLRRTLRAGGFEIWCDRDFEGVMRRCAAPAPDRPNTWINDEIIRLYTGLYERGLAHSVEVWRGDDMIGGLYGVSLNAAFFGESMFSRVTDASKIALVHLVARLIRSGYMLLDAQFQTAHLRRFGAVEISRAQYHKRLAQALARQTRFQPGLTEDPVAVIQSTTQTS